MKNFIKTIGLTFYSGDFYKKIKDDKTEDAVVFLLKTSVFLGLCVGLLGSIALFVFSPTLKNAASKFIGDNFPSDLVVTVKDGKMTTSTDKPFFIKMPISEAKSGSKANMFAILPGETADVSVLEKNNTMLAMTSNGFVGEKGNGGEIRIYKYGDMSFVASKDSAMGILYKISPVLLVFGVIGIFIFGVMFLFFSILYYAIWLFFAALLIWGFLVMKKLKISYKQSYKIGMYAIVPLVIIEIVTFPLKLSGKFLTTAIIVAVVLFVTHKWVNDETKADFPSQANNI